MGNGVSIEVLSRMENKLILIRTIKQQKVACLRHVLRHDLYHHLQTIMMAKIPGKRQVRRRKMSWLRNIRNRNKDGAAAVQWFSMVCYWFDALTHDFAL